MRKSVQFLAMALVVAFAAGAVSVAGEPAGLPGTYAAKIEKPEGGYKIGVANNIIGNSWRAQWIEGVELAGEEAKAAGLIGEIVVVSSNADLTTQLNQINSLVQDGCNAILIDPVSDTGCAPAIRAAINAGVLVFILTDPAAYEGTTALLADTVGVWQPQVQYFFSQFPEQGGEYMYLSGIPGLTTDTQRTGVVTKVNERYPNVKQVLSAPGNYQASDIQAAVLNLLAAHPNYDGVLPQEAEGDATIAAFKTAGAELPNIMGADSSAFFLRTWQKEFPNTKACSTAFPICSGYNGVKMAARILNGATFKNGVLKPNPMNPGMVNSVLFETPYVVTAEGSTGKEEWAQVEGVDFSMTEYITLDEAVKLLEGKPDTAVLDRYLTEEQINSFFN